MPRSLDGKRDMIACRICVYFLRRATISSPGEVETTGWSTAGILFYYWYKIGHDRRMRGLFIRFKHVPRQYISLCVFSFRIGEWMSPRANRAARTCFRIKKRIVVVEQLWFFLATWRWVHGGFSQSARASCSFWKVFHLWRWPGNPVVLHIISYYLASKKKIGRWFTHLPKLFGEGLEAPACLWLSRLSAVILICPLWIRTDVGMV